VKISILSALRLGAAPFAVGIATLCTPAQAQQTALPPAAEPAGTEAAPIIVTGTRIRLPNLTSLEPTVTLDREYLRDRGLTNIADVLNESPGVRGSITPNGAQSPFGQGMNFANLYGLGINRTLTLVDGMRVVSSNVPVSPNASPGTSVDLNIIPTILIDRADRVSVGGAPVYGTDAIAGTINVLLKRRFSGLDLQATSGLSGEGDNARYNLSALGGLDFAGGRGNVTAAISYDNVGGVAGNARSYYRANVFSLINANLSGLTPATDGRLNPAIGYDSGPSDGNPGTVLVANANFYPLSPGGVIASGPGAFALQFDPSGNLVPYNPGIPYAAGRASGGDGYRPNDYVQLTSNLERLNTALFATYDLTDRISLFAEGLYSHSVSAQMAAAPTYNSVITGGRNAALMFSVANPLLSAQARQALVDNGYSTFVLSRANSDLADTAGQTTADLYRVIGGARGTVALGGRIYDFEVSVNYGRSDVVDRFQDINQQNFINAVNGCSTTVTVFGTGGVPVADPACAPLSLFGSGVASPQALAYVLQNNVTRSRLEQFVANANVGGSPFELFGNPVAFNLGFEHHEEKGRFTPDPFIQAGLGRSGMVTPTSGAYHMNEEFAEVLVPFVTPQNGAVISKLEAFGRFRNVDNSTNGSFQSWAAGGAFAPIRDIEFRGNFTRSFRTPSITELYSARALGFFAVPDLCSPANINAGPAPTVRATNCAAFLAQYPGATPLAAATLGAPGYFGGNPNLRNEVADSFTYGVLLQPSFVPNLSVTVDYINIKIKDPITLLLPTSIASGCFDNVSFNAADPANGNGFCSLIQRDANGQVVYSTTNPGVTAGYVNGKQIRMDAVQAAVNYMTGLERLNLPGNLAVGVDVFHLRNRLNDVTGVAPVQSEGLVGDPKWQGQLRLRYENQTWGIGSNVNYTGAQAVAYTNRGASPSDIREIDHFDPFATVDSSVWFKTDDGFRLTLSVTNVFNRVGQEYNGYIVPASINDALGRRFSLSIGKHF